ALWEAVQKRLQSARQAYLRGTDGKLHGRPESGRASRYLLSGLARCGCCGGSMIATGIPHGSAATRRYVPHYVCSYSDRRGSTVCSNRLRRRVETLDTAVIGELESRVLTPANIDYVVERRAHLLRQRLQQEPDRAARLEAEIQKVRKELEHYVAAVAQGIDLP